MRAGLPLLLLGLVGVVLGCGGGPVVQPNIILVIADDLDWETLRYTERIRPLLADQGLSFDSFFTPRATCCPSRASLLRGQYAHNHGVLHNSLPTGGYQRYLENGHEASNVAIWLRDAGYATLLLGKYLNHYPLAGAPTHIPPGWTEWFASKGGGWGFDYLINDNGALRNRTDYDDLYFTDLLAARAARFIREHRDRPFYVHLSTVAPHRPSVPAPRHKGAFADAALPRGPSFDEVDLSDKAGWMRDLRPLSRPVVRRLEESFRLRLESMLAVEDLLATLLETLESEDLLETSYLFFISDNGYHLGHHRLPGGKNTLYEEDVRVPMIVRGPGVPRGEVRSQLALNHDLPVTFADLAGTDPPDFVDGRSLAPLLSASPPQPGEWRSRVLLEHFDRPNQPPGPRNPLAGRAVRTADRKLIEYEDGDLELYDLVRDPHELDSLARDPAWAGEVERLSGLLAELVDCAGQEGCGRAEGVN